MAHLQYMPGDPRLVDQLVYELKSKGIFDQFRKECIADVDTRPAYQNLRQRVENSVSSFLSRQCWKPELNKNQLREKLRKHLLDGNYLEQGVERIVDQVVNPKVASVFIPQVEDLVYNYLGISRKKTTPTAETSNGKISTDDLLPTDLEAVSPGSVKSNDDKHEPMDEDVMEEKMEVEEQVKEETEKKDDLKEEIQVPMSELVIDSENSEDKKLTGMEEIKLENIPPPDNSPPKIDLDKIELPTMPEIPHPDEIPLPKEEKETYFKPLNAHSDDDSSSDSSLRRNMSPLTPIRNYNNENSCDAQQAFENDSDSKSNDKKEPNTFRFAIDAKSPDSVEEKTEKKDPEVPFQFNNQPNVNTFNTPLYDDSSNSNNLQIDYESDANSKTNNAEKPAEPVDQAEDIKKDKKPEEKKSRESSSHRSSHRSRDSHRHSSSKDKRSDSKQSRSRDSSRHDKKKEDHSKSKSSHKEREKSRDRSDKKDSRDSSKHRSSSHKSSSHRDSKSHRSSSSSQRHSSDKDKKSDDKRSSSHKDRSERSSDKSSRDKKDSKSSSHRSDRDKKSSSKSKHEDKDKKKEKKDVDDHYSLSGRGNNGRRSTDRDSNDGSSSSKGSQNHSSAKTAETKKESKESSSKSDNTSTSGESASPGDKEQVMNKASDNKPNQKPIRVENHLEVPIASPPRLPFVPDVTLKKPKFAANLEEAKRMMKMRKFLDEEQKRMNQEAALLLEFQANVRPSLSQVYSSIPGPELEFACVTHANDTIEYTESQIKIELVPIDSDNTQENIETIANIKREIMDSPVNEFVEENELKTDKQETYYENKPFSQLMEEISEISKASEKKKDEAKQDSNSQDDETKKRSDYFEVTIITEELSESDEPIIKQKPAEKSVESKTEIGNETKDNESLKYFAEHEKYEAEMKRHQYSNFLKSFTEKVSMNRIFLLNCDTYEENILKEVYSTMGEYEIVNYYKNGHLKVPKTNKNVVKNVNLASEITLPLESSYEPKSPTITYSKSPSPVFSPVKSECSFELSSDYDAKLEEMVNKTSRQEVMEIILGSVIESDHPTIDYCTESSIESELNLKRKLVEVESSVNNNRQVLTKMRKLSDSDQITSTTEDLPNSPSSDKSVENYEQNTASPQTPNGKVKPAPRNKVQRYDTSDLYKPKLHYLSRRNNIS
ncbi:uncharacterized protein LOC142983474 isoform X2 [Anticarsia gemmatalis]|uniref:uncharacterized protein LOC142983474 isoform X2 n=1 Tax=Anticarsia gemmatalis TaxID=129554 RepID=UPI003F7627B5